VLAELCEKLKPFYSEIGRPSIDPELMLPNVVDLGMNVGSVKGSAMTNRDDDTMKITIAIGATS
jgi:hypothetical protein